ncbi:hypothetical protein U1Q18_015583 [Sarracenia purpurea var. burkii]
MGLFMICLYRSSVGDRGDFEKGRELWEDATHLGITLQCSSDMLDSSVTKVFIDQLNNFAGSSMKMLTELEKGIQEAKIKLQY